MSDVAMSVEAIVRAQKQLSASVGRLVGSLILERNPQLKIARATVPESYGVAADDEWEDEEDQVVDEASPPAEFMTDVLRVLTTFHQQATELYDRFQMLPDTRGMNALDDLLGSAEQYSRELVLAGLFTANGEPTTQEDLRSNYLERRPALACLDGLCFAVKPHTIDRDDAGRERRIWKLSITDDL